MRHLFKLGSQFEVYEFDIEYRKELKYGNLIFDVYNYIKSKNDKIEIFLIYNTDILEGVIILKRGNMIYSEFSKILKGLDFQQLAISKI